MAAFTIAEHRACSLDWELEILVSDTREPFVVGERKRKKALDSTINELNLKISHFFVHEANSSTVSSANENIFPHSSFSLIAPCVIIIQQRVSSNMSTATTCWCLHSASS